MKKCKSTKDMNSQIHIMVFFFKKKHCRSKSFENDKTPPDIYWKSPILSLLDFKDKNPILRFNVLEPFRSIFTFNEVN